MKRCFYCDRYAARMSRTCRQCAPHHQALIRKVIAELTAQTDAHSPQCECRICKRLRSWDRELREPEPHIDTTAGTR